MLFSAEERPGEFRERTGCELTFRVMADALTGGSRS
jgi:hypothetical protein